METRCDIPTDLFGKVDMFGNSIDLKYGTLVNSALTCFRMREEGSLTCTQYCPTTEAVRVILFLCLS